jgi:MurNAc alpha-1-phosphate uridylyltransferase
MILAAGKGERMRPLTDTLPKPLLCVAGKPLIVYHLEKLAAMGVREVIINIAYLGDKIREALGDGSTWGLSIHYSEEPEPLETAGALLHALPLLGDQPFLLVNGDVWIEMDFATLIEKPLGECLARLVLVDNPNHNADGDFSFNGERVLEKQSSLPAYTFSGVGVFDPKLIACYPNKRTIFPLKEVLVDAIRHKVLSGILFEGDWRDIGTPERLSELNASYC